MKNITDSIEYAKNIQHTMLPTNKSIYKLFRQYFLIYLPKNVVSGDFYFCKNYNNKKLFILADCTGHGIPGAFISILGISLINKILINNKYLSAADILNILRKEMYSSLKNSSDEEPRDGMDIAVCIYDENTRNLQFAGAHQKLFYIENDELIVHNGDRIPIGIYNYDYKYTNYNISLKKGTMVYLSSDGYFDQYGGEKNKKIMLKNFKGNLKKIYKLAPYEQYDYLYEYFNNWKGNGEQTDDVLVIGIKIK